MTAGEHAAEPRRTRPLAVVGSQISVEEVLFGKAFDRWVLGRIAGFLAPYRRQLLFGVFGVLVFTGTQLAIPLRGSRWSRPCPTPPPEQPEEERRADHRGQDPERDLDGRDRARERVDGEHVARAEQRRRRQAAARSPGPTIIRAICGITSPTQPTTPATATTLAVIRVAQTMTTRRSRPASTPSARASSSPSASTLIRQRRATSGTRPASTTGRGGQDVLGLYPGEAAEQPEGDGRKLVVGIGQHLQAARSPLRSARPPPRRRAPGSACGRRRSPRRRRSRPAPPPRARPRSPSAGWPCTGQRQEDPEHRAEPGARRDAENVGRDERDCGTASGSRRRRRRAPRRPAARAATLGSRIESSTVSACPPAPAADEDRERLAQPQRVRADQQRRERAGDQRGRQPERRPGPAREAGRQGARPLAHSSSRSSSASPRSTRYQSL